MNERANHILGVLSLVLSLRLLSPLSGSPRRGVRASDSSVSAFSHPRDRGCPRASIPAEFSRFPGGVFCFLCSKGWNYLFERLDV